VSPDDFPALRRYRRILFEDFEYATAPGERPRPVCVATLDWRTDHLESRWLWNQQAPSSPVVDADELYVCYHAPAELCSRLALGWPLPENVLDLCVEFKRKENGDSKWGDRKLTTALLAHGIDVVQFADKHTMQMLAASGGPFTEQQQADLSHYNARDVRALEHLLSAMLPKLDLPRAVYRGAYMREVAKIEHNGIPINGEELRILAENWETLKAALIRDTDPDGSLWDGLSFRRNRWEGWIASRGLPWPRLASGQPCLRKDVFREMAERYPEVEPIRALRSLLSQLRHFTLPLGSDSRARCSTYTFGTITGRNTPDATDFIFSWPRWCRGLIQAPPSRALINLDFSQQEYLIAGTLSGDPQLLADYAQGDVYVALGKTLGMIPPSGNAKTHLKERDRCKTVTLAVNYGMGPYTLSKKLGISEPAAAALLRKHHEKYPQFCRWSDATVDYARTYGRLWTKYGWTVRVKRGSKDTTWRNWRVQATGGEVLRAAVCALGGAGFMIDATVHDSVLIETDAREAAAAALEAERIMAEASAVVLGQPCRVKSYIAHPGERLWEDGKPSPTWERIWRLIFDQCCAGEQVVLRR
jgi:hypothetical protein